jgi:3-oxoacyl-[acyl-carrier protein] reductase
MGLLEGKVAIVTGGATGLGKAYCLGMAEAGAKVVVFDIAEQAQQTAAEIKGKGGSAMAFIGDVASVEDTRRMAEDTVKQFHRIDILVNNAAMASGLTRKPFVELPIEEWDRLMAVNLKGTFLCCRAVFPQMKAQGKGKIINVSSVSAYTGGGSFIHYVTSKGGVLSFTRGLAAEVGRYGICVNSIAPGVINTESTTSTIADIAKAMTNLTPLGRLGEPDDLVGAVIFLSSDHSDYITGQTLRVDGGRYMG